MENLAPLFIIGAMVVALLAAWPVERAVGRPEATVILLDMDVIKQIESGGNCKAVSPCGARGPYQLCRRAWEDAAASIRRRHGIVESDAEFDYDRWVEDETVSRCMAYEYITRVLPRYLTAEKLFQGDKTRPAPDCLDARLAAYNAGAQTVRRAYTRDPTNWHIHLPRETRDYISRYHRAVKAKATIQQTQETRHARN